MGFEVAPDEYVVLDKEEIKAAAGDRGKVVDIEEFVDAVEIDPIFYEKTYYVGSRNDEDAYRLLYEALQRSGRAGIGRFTFHDREYLVAVRALEEVIAHPSSAGCHEVGISRGPFRCRFGACPWRRRHPR
jgi:DNA end-binding protein Ku